MKHTQLIWAYEVGVPEVVWEFYMIPISEVLEYGADTATVVVEHTGNARVVPLKDLEVIECETGVLVL